MYKKLKFHSLGYPIGLLGTKFQFFYLPDMKKELFEQTLLPILPMGVLTFFYLKRFKLYMKKNTKMSL